MMKKALVSTALLASFMTMAQAHTLWVVGENKEALKADIVFGHNFPKPEVIGRSAALIGPVSVIGSNYKSTLTQKGENYHYEGKKLDKGTYLLIAEYKPTSLIEKEDGTRETNKTRKDISDAVKSCRIVSMSAKSIMVVGVDGETFALKPIGKGLELTPLNVPSQIKKDAAVRFRLTKDGKPVKREKIFGSVSGFSASDSSGAFYATSDLNGEFEFKAHKEGLWYLKTTLKTETGDKECESLNETASLSFIVN